MECKTIYLLINILVVNEALGINLNLQLSNLNEQPNQNNQQECVNYHISVPDENKSRTIAKFRDDYTFYHGYGYYKYHVNPAPWLTAKYICELEGAHLAVIDSQRKADLLVLIFNSHPRSQVLSPNQFFIGFHCLHVEGQYETIFGTPLKDSGYTKWIQGQPSKSKDEKCGSFALTGLDDFPCSYTSNFICEKQI